MPKFVPSASDRKIVMLASGCGYTEAAIARMITNPETGKSISIPTLLDRFREEIDTGREKVMLAIAGTLYAVATDRNHKGCVPAGIYLSKVIGKWREPEPEWAERRRIEATATAKAKAGTVDEDIEIEVTLVFDEEEERARRRQQEQDEA